MRRRSALRTGTAIGDELADVLYTLFRLADRYGV